MSPSEARENALATVEEVIETIESTRALLKIYSGARSPLTLSERQNLRLHIDRLSEATGYLGALVWVQPSLL